MKRSEVKKYQLPTFEQNQIFETNCNRWSLFSVVVFIFGGIAIFVELLLYAILGAPFWKMVAFTIGMGGVSIVLFIPVVILIAFATILRKTEQRKKILRPPDLEIPGIGLLDEGLRIGSYEVKKAERDRIFLADTQRNYVKEFILQHKSKGDKEGLWRSMERIHNAEISEPDSLLNLIKKITKYEEIK